MKCLVSISFLKIKLFIKDGLTELFLCMIKEDLIKLIVDEQSKIASSNSFGEKADRTNNILQLKIASNIPELQSDIYINVKNYIHYYIISLEEKQFNYDEFESERLLAYVKLFSVEQKCSLLHFTIRQLKTIGFEEKVKFFEKQLRLCELLKEWKSLSFHNFFKILYFATVYNNISILISILFCITVKMIVYLPAPVSWMALYKVNYIEVSDNWWLNHIGNVLLSIFEVQEHPSFVEPINFLGAVFFVLGKCFFIIIVINILIDQLKSRFKF